MNPKTKKKVIIGGALLAIAGVCVYLYIQHKNKNKQGDAPLIDESGKPIGETNTTTTSSGGGILGNIFGGSSSSSAPTNDVLGFQKFANSKGYSPKLVEDGVWGSKSSKAWAIHGAEFSKLKPTTNATVVNLQPKKVYATLNATPVWSGLNDLVPYRLASSGELLGEPIIINGNVTILTGSSGSKYIAIRTPNGNKYVSTSNVKIK